MAYDLSQRFPSTRKYHRYNDPGAYQYPYPPLIKPNKVPFLSKTRRKTEFGRIWTHAIYDPKLQSHIPNCTSLQSKIPRFHCEDYDHEDMDEYLCDCGIGKQCDCHVEVNTKSKDNITKEEICQAKVRRRIFKGTTGGVLEDISESSKREIIFDPPFYDIRVQESTAFYRGWKWSKWTSKRDMKSPELGPGPAAYTIKQEPDSIEICAEKVRAHKRKTSRQLRFIEMVQRLTLLANQPGPASYSPILQRRKDFHYTVSKPQNEEPKMLNDQGPGPADYHVKRDFDLEKHSHISCHAKLVPPAPFGFKAVRFKHRYEEGPSPASYNTNNNTSRLIRCTKAPFGSSAQRFNETIDDDDDDEIVEEEDHEKQPKDNDQCKPSWQFSSKTVRMKPPNINNNQSYPTPQINKHEIRRSLKLQYISPFHSSDGRFRNWYSWIDVYAREDIPGPAYYCLEKPKCVPAVSFGPIVRSRRFKSSTQDTPAPNRFILCGIENVIKTHNLRLKNNISRQHKFHWVPPHEMSKLSPEEQEIKLFNESIALLNAEDVFGNDNNKSSIHELHFTQDNRKKRLRCFEGKL